MMGTYTGKLSFEDIEFGVWKLTTTTGQVYELSFDEPPPDDAIGTEVEIGGSPAPTDGVSISMSGHPTLIVTTWKRAAGTG